LPSHRFYLNNLPYVARLSQDVDDSRRASSFLRRLAGRACSPREYKTVTSEAACDVQEAGEVSSGNVEDRNRNDESCDCHAHRYDDMPATLAESIAVVRHGESDESADEVGRCGADERDGAGAQIEAAYDAWVKVVEAVGGVVGGEHDGLATSLVACLL
jgi:hypothetical protein